MKILKAILLFIPKIIMSLLNTVWFLICLAVTYICCFGVLIVWCFKYKKLRNGGAGLFHGLFFRGPFALYRACKFYKLIWEL